MYKALFALLSLCIICWIIQLLPVISVPITSPSLNIYLSSYENYEFGVFGICDQTKKICSSPRIGYPSTNSSFYNAAPDRNFGFGGVVLPSRVRYTISKLLVVHVVDFCFSSLLLIVTASLLTTVLIDKFKFEKLKGQYDEEGIPKTIPKRDLTPYLNIMLILTLFSVLTTLLAFLADILLFIPNLSYLGWIQLVPIVSMALITSMLCFIKRSISSRKFFEDNNEYANDDMRMMNKPNVVGSDDDNLSDDGFYVYTDGFYTRGAENNQDERRRNNNRPENTDASIMTEIELNDLR
ncbi:unnamed protein product [Candida verbasci]|uniref:PH-response regulator protein palI/RIM9 n=1 Tax=Candida verbasci TaxID=1227364 RepID=A0A9W4TYI0_9ASCO|nr:unnamed protein product [Candida verbasci]